MIIEHILLVFNLKIATYYEKVTCYIISKETISLLRIEKQ